MKERTMGLSRGDTEGKGIDVWEKGMYLRMADATEAWFCIH